MARFELTRDLLAGVPEIDDQHRELLELGNVVVDPATLNQGAAVFREALRFLAGYVRYHFAAEEHVMQKAGYPRFEQHRQWHERFRRDVDRLVEKARRSGVSKAIAVEVSFAIENWLLEHIRITDKDFVTFLRQHTNGKEHRLPDVATLKRARLLADDFDERLVRVVLPSRPPKTSYGSSWQRARASVR
jgi:hemerythrin